jgi:hypothetical protein
MYNESTVNFPDRTGKFFWQEEEEENESDREVSFFPLFLRGDQI